MSEAVTTDYRAVLRDATPVIDVRSPSEFSKGSVPAAINLPILDDEERAQVGIKYKQNGNEAAVQLGHELVTGDKKRTRVQGWAEFVSAHPNALLTCWRGGLRSKIAQQWLQEVGIQITRIDGGTKALRQSCLDIIDSTADFDFVVLGGRTGCGKTEIVNAMRPSIDLEGLANHRGSSFGRLKTPQPTPINFENALAAELLRMPVDSPVLLEDESRTIGRLAIPGTMFDAMRQAPIVVLKEPLNKRAIFTYNSYVVDQDQEALELALDRIQKRLGGDRYKAIRSLMATAFGSGKREDHIEWISDLLEQYYDPMYDYQLDKKSKRVVFEGDSKEVAEHLREVYRIE